MSRDRKSCVSALDGSEVAWSEAEVAWSAAAFDILRDLAGHDQAIVEDHELAKEVQRRAQIHTASPMRHWMRAVLHRVTQRAHEHGLPPLATLVVGRHDGMVGDVHDDVRAVRGDPPVGDPDGREDAAARDRLECYRWAHAVAGHRGTPALSPKLQKQRDRTAREQLATRQMRLGNACPGCGLTMPLTGVCDDCD